MRWSALALLALFIPGFADAQERTPAAPTHVVALNGHSFTLPVGFEIELVAGPPLVNRPITADFDEEGRLYVSDSSGSNEKVEEQLKKTPHRIQRLEDSKGTSRFDKATVFADKMMFPEGTMWLNGSLYVAAPPQIWKLTDTKGDGVADRREIWFDGKTLTGCANDLHGPYRGPDGWIYWCKGAFAKQTYERPGKPPFVTRAAHIFRARPDGTDIEPVMTGGMDNPVDVVFTPTGERIFSTTFFQHPGGGQRDGLIHAVYGGIYGKDHDVIHDRVHKWTSPEVMPVMTHMGPAAPCGLHRYESGAFGKDYKDNLFACQFNMRKVSRHILIPEGSTFKTKDEDFLVSDNHDFHPTDVIEDADGSLIVIDTGGWYKLCCPTSQLVKPDVLGAIYRVRRKDAPKIDDPRGKKIAWDELTAGALAKLLDDPRPVVRRRAIERLGTMPESALPVLERVLRESMSPEAKRNSLWAAARYDLLPNRSFHPGPGMPHILISCINLARQALSDRDESVRHVALYLASLYRDKGVVKEVEKLLETDTPQNRRIAAEALGRIREPGALPVLFDALATDHDRVLDHCLTYAMIEIGDPKKTFPGDAYTNPSVRRACLIAIDQMGGSGPAPGQVTACLKSRTRDLRDTALWVAGLHAESSDELADYFRYGLREELPDRERDELMTQMARLAGNQKIQALLTDLVEKAEKSPAFAAVALRAMARSGLKKTPPYWFDAIQSALAVSHERVQHEAVAAFRALPPDTAPASLVDALVSIGQDEKRDEALRLAALAAVPPGRLKPADGMISLLVSRLDKEQPVSARATAADVLTRAKLTPEQLIHLSEALKSTGPMEITKLLDAFAKTTDEKVGLSLVAALNDPAVRPMVRTEQVKPKLEKYPATVQEAATRLYAALDADLVQQRAKLESMLSSLKDGEVRRGQSVFNGQKAACATCHKIGYVGGTIGPDLTRIGSIRTERDLLESIVFPSASFVRSYEPVHITTKKGKDYNGILKKDAPDEVILTLNAQEEVRLSRDEIEEMVPSKVSIMPAGLDQQLSQRDLADLVAFLKACK
jgi:putative membrane-bound dehydrogenase-like protein